MVNFFLRKILRGTINEAISFIDIDVNCQFQPMKLRNLDFHRKCSLRGN